MGNLKAAIGNRDTAMGNRDTAIGNRGIAMQNRQCDGRLICGLWRLYGI